MKLDVLDARGKEVESIEADDAVFGLQPNQFVMHQALLAQLANRRAGSASTKTRGEVAGSTIKVHRQKGTGRARLGSIRSPAIRHGGIAFGPKPRDFSQRLPKRMRRLAIRSVLSAKVADGTLRVLDSLTMEKPRTKEMVSLLGSLGLERSTLVVTETSDRNVLISSRNIERVTVLPASYLNVADMLAHQNIIMTVGAVRKAEQLWGGERAVRRRAPIPELEPAAPVAARPRRRRTTAAAAPKVDAADTKAAAEETVADA